MKRNNRYSSLAVIFALHFLFSTNVQSQSELIGKPAPELTLEKLLQAPESIELSWEKLRGKAVVLEFWATWCAPCVAALPHINELAEKFKNSPVVFISITDEDELKVTRFLQKRKMNSIIGLDRDRSIFKAFSIFTLPKTILVNPQGKIVIVTTYPLKVSEETIANLLASGGLKKPKSKEVTQVESADKPETPASLFEIVIRPSNRKYFSSFINKAKGKLKANAATLHWVLSQAYDISTTQIIGIDKKLDQKYQIVVTIPEEQSHLFDSVFQKILDISFGLRTHRETREMKVFILKSPERTPSGIYPSDAKSGHLSTDEGLILASHSKIDGLVKQLEQLLNRPVFNETGLEGYYDWDLEYNREQPESVVDSIHDQLGLEMKSVKREVEVLVVESLNDARSAKSVKEKF